jgi:hypothetical protein
MEAPMARLLTVLALGAALLAPGALAQGPAAEPGFVTGSVKDRAGNPLSGVVVFVDGFDDRNLVQTTKEDGLFRMRLPPGAYRAVATMKRPFDGQVFEIELKPDSTDTFDSVDGAVRNFIWELTGEKVAPAMGSFGAFVYVNLGTDFIYVEDPENITFTLTPAGPLIDGSQGEVIVRKGGAPRSPEYGKILDIPTGRYTITGVYAPPGMKPQTLRFKDAWARGGEFRESLEFGISAQGNYCNTCASLDVESPKAPEPL